MQETHFAGSTLIPILDLLVFSFYVLLLKFDEAGLSYIKLIGDVKGNIINIIIIPSR